MIDLSAFGLSNIGKGPVYERPIVVPRNFEIFYILSELVQPKIIVEVGSWEGSSALSWGIASKPYDTSIICIDTWLGSVEHYQDQLHGSEWGRERIFFEDGYPTIYKTFVTNVRVNRLEDRVTALPIDSRQAFIILEKANISPDICYIDAAHDYESVISDLYGAKRIGSKLICGDDYYYHNGTDIKTAVDFFANEIGSSVVTKQNQFIIIDDKDTDLYKTLIGFGWDDC